MQKLHSGFPVGILCCLLLFCLSAQTALAKEDLPATIFTLKNDTLHGEIKVPKAFVKEKERGFASLQFEIQFTDAAGVKKTFKPGDIKGFVVETGDNEFERYVSVTL